MLVLSTRIVLDCFYLLIFYSEKFSTDVRRLPYAVNVNLNLSNVFWIALIIVEDNKDRRILHVVHARIVQITLGIDIVFWWRSRVTTCAGGVRTNQYPGQKHVAMMMLTWFCVIFAI